MDLYWTELIDTWVIGYFRVCGRDHLDGPDSLLRMDGVRPDCPVDSERDATIESALKEVRNNSLYSRTYPRPSTCSQLGTVEGLASLTYPRFWPKDASSMIGSIHLQFTPSASSYDPHGPHLITKRAYSNMDRVVGRVDYILRNRIQGLDELTIQVEEGTRDAVML